MSKPGPEAPQDTEGAGLPARSANGIRTLPFLIAFLAAALLGPTASAQETLPYTVEKLETDGLYGRFYYPTGQTNRPTVVVIGGSESGVGFSDPFGPALANIGIAVLALPYHNYETLPGALELVPLEYFDRAIAWVQDHPATDSDRVGLIGHSRGGEGALLVASRNDAVRVVVASVPGAYAAPAVNLCNYPSLAAAWTQGGEPLAYLPTDRQTEPKRDDETWPQWLARTEEARTSDARAQSFETLKEDSRFESIAIPVERISGPVLFLSAGQDEVWASAAMSAYMVDRLRERGFVHPTAHVTYPKAGHLFFSPPGLRAGARGTPACSRSGGESERLSAADEEARESSWAILVAFLRTYLRP